MSATETFDRFVLGVQYWYLNSQVNVGHIHIGTTACEGERSLGVLFFPLKKSCCLPIGENYMSLHFPSRANSASLGLFQVGKMEWGKHFLPTGCSSSTNWASVCPGLYP